MIRVRFAPSPTGYLHVGGARTALFNWLFARRHGGVFVLRIEDTDVERSSSEMVDGILDGLRWLGLDWDEGPKIGGPHGPYFQSERLDRYRAMVEKLVAEGHAYYCYCTPDELKARREAGERASGGWKYDRKCLQLTADEVAARERDRVPRAVRIEVPDGRIAFDDLVHGRIEVDAANIEDFVIARSDGQPTYQLSVVSDDVEMKITHVVRGDDHISNTPKQILIYQGLGHEAPTFAHVPMILGSDGKRLSKRHGATAVGEYQTQGILPEALNNFLVLLGWNPGTDQEIFSLEEMIQVFSLENINKKSSVFDTAKLEWMNSQYIQRMLASEIEERIADDLNAIPGWSATAPEWRHKLIDLLKVRTKSLHGIADLARPYLQEKIDFDQSSVDKHWKDPADAAEKILKVRDRIGNAEWNEKALEDAIRSVAEELGVGAGKVIHPLRVAVTGTAASPPMFDVLVVLGRDRVLRRIAVALDMLGHHQ